MEHSGHDFKDIYSITGCHLVSHLWVDVTTALHSSLLASLMPPGQLSALPLLREAVLEPRNDAWHIVSTRKGYVSQSRHKLTLLERCEALLRPLWSCL